MPRLRRQPTLAPAARDFPTETLHEISLLDESVSRRRHRIDVHYSARPNLVQREERFYMRVGATRSF